MFGFPDERSEALPTVGRGIRPGHPGPNEGGPHPPGGGTARSARGDFRGAFVPGRRGEKAERSRDRAGTSGSRAFEWRGTRKLKRRKGSRAGGPREGEERLRARDYGLHLGALDPGPTNAITDVPGVAVGHTTVWKGESVRTGVTAIVPKEGIRPGRPVPGAVHVFNAFGKLVGGSQVEELGEIETPILLTSTLNVARVADALIDHVLGQPGNEAIESVNPLVAETNDRLLNDARTRPVDREAVYSAIDGARLSAPEEGSVGAGTGTVAFGFKGGIGTSSRWLPSASGGCSLGVLVQTNYGGRLTIAGAPVGLELPHRHPRTGGAPGGSVVVVLATDAPLDARNLRRLARRSMLGIARTGADGSNASGDYAIAFSTAEGGRPVPNRAMDPLFGAAIEATEEAVYNSLFRARTVTGRGRTVEALPLRATLAILRRHQCLSADQDPGIPPP